MQLILTLSTKVQLLNDTAKRCNDVVCPLLGYDLLGLKDQHPRVYTYLAVYRFRPNLNFC